MTKTHQETDGLCDFDLEQIGMQGGAFGGARLLKFTTSNQFATREGEIVGPERELICLGLKKIIQKFVNKQLVDTIPVPDGERAPNVVEMNENAPREEWGMGLDGQPAGPYSLVLVLKLLDASNMDRFAFITKSKGGAIAIGDLSDRTKIMRRLNGPDVSPVISCTLTSFRIARLNITRQRPDFRVLRWVKLGDGGGQTVIPAPTPQRPASAAATLHLFAKGAKEAPAAQSPAASATAAPPQTQRPATAAEAGRTVVGGKPATLGTPVREPTLREEMGDELPW